MRVTLYLLDDVVINNLLFRCSSLGDDSLTSNGLSGNKSTSRHVDWCDKRIARCVVGIVPIAEVLLLPAGHTHSVEVHGHTTLAVWLVWSLHRAYKVHNPVLR